MGNEKKERKSELLLFHLLCNTTGMSAIQNNYKCYYYQEIIIYRPCFEFTGFFQISSYFDAKHC